MLSAMETSPTDARPRPPAGGASGASAAEGAPGDACETSAADAKAPEGATLRVDSGPRVDVESPSDANSRGGSGAEPSARGDCEARVDVDAGARTGAPSADSAQLPNGAPDAGPAPLVVPDLDSSVGDEASAARSDGGGSSRSEADEVRLRLSDSDAETGDHRLTDDEDRPPRDEAADSSADPVDLPDDMFESAAALNAAEEEEERERREANQRALAALEAADSLDGCGDALDDGDDVAAASAGPPLCHDDAAMDGQEAGDSMDGQEAGDSIDAAEAGDSQDAAEAGDSIEAAEAGDSMDVAEAGDSIEAGEAGDSQDATSPPGDLSSLIDAENSMSAVLCDADDPDDPAEGSTDDRAGSRKRAGSPAVGLEASKVRRLEAPRPFIEVKKVQLNEDNMRRLQESNERDRRRLEESAVPATPPATVNGVKSSLLQRVKQLSRQELEKLVLEKMCDAIASRSVIGDMKRSAEKHVIAAERFQKKITYLQKQVGDLHLVVRKLSAELKARRSPSYPVKITRTVGLQVTLAKSVPPLSSRPRPGASPASTPASTPANTPVSNGVLRAQLSSPIRPRAAPASARVTPSGGGQVALVPVVRTVLPLGSVPLSGVTSPQRSAGAPGSPVAAASAAQRMSPAGPQKRQLYSTKLGRPAGGWSPRRSAGSSPSPVRQSADVVDLTDDDDASRPGSRGGGGGGGGGPPRRPAGPPSAMAVSVRSGTVSGGVALRRLSHPAPFPVTPLNPAVHTGQLLPPPPSLKVTRRANGIVLSWTMDLTPRHATVVSYHLFAYQEAGPVSLRSNPWKKVGDVRALPLPMACTLTQFQEGHKYHFAVRAEDSFRRRGQFSNPSSIALMGPS